ncbi:MAG: TIGR01841 family phasin [Rhodospirillales bacterium]|nr:TIGR01841 family phasin [Rhodospirillales bacterium]
MTAKKKNTAQNTAQFDASEQVSAAVAAGKDAVESVVKAGNEAAAKGLEQAVALTKEQVEAAAKTGSEVFRTVEDMVAFSKANMDAVMASSSIFAKGIQDFNSLMFDLAQTSLEDSVAATQALLKCKSVTEAVEVQNDLVRNSYTKTVNDSRKLSDISARVSEASLAPLSDRFNEAVERLSKPLAA